MYAWIYTIILFKCVCRCAQTAVRNSCSIISVDVSNCSHRLKEHHLTSLVSVRRSNLFIRKKHPKTIANIESPARVFIWMNQRPASACRKGAITASRLGASFPSNSDNLIDDGGVCARACMRTCMHASVRACMRACVMSLQYTIIIFDSWRLIMIIIYIIMQYFKQITQTDDFASTGTRLKEGDGVMILPGSLLSMPTSIDCRNVWV